MSAGVIPGPCYEFRTDERIVCRQCALSNGVSSVGRQVEETKVVAGLQVDDDVATARCIIVAGPAGIVDHLIRIIGNLLRCSGNNTVNVAAVPDGEPYIVVGIQVVGTAFARLGIDYIQGEGEGLLRIRVFAVDNLLDVKLRTSVVDSGKRCRSCIADVVCLSADGVFGRVTGVVVRCCSLEDEHGQSTVDQHRTHGRHIEFPIVSEVRRLLEREVMARFQNLEFRTVTVRQCSAVGMAKDTDGNVDVVTPITLTIGIIGIQRFAKRHCIMSFAVTRDREDDLLSFSSVQHVLPFLGDCQFLDSGSGDRIGILVFLAVALTGTGIGIGDGSGGVGLKVAVLVDVFLDVRIQRIIRTRIVLDIGNNVECGLAGPAVEGDRVGHAVLEDAFGRQIPLNGTVRKGGRRSIRPLIAQAAVGSGAVVTAGTIILIGRSIYRQQIADLARGSSDAGGGAVFHGNSADAGHLNALENRSERIV